MIHSTSLQLARLVERITRSFGEKRLTGAVFFDVAKAFDTVWIDGLLYKLTLLNFPSYIVDTISSYLRGRTFEASFQTATSSRRGMRAGVAGLISPVFFSLYVNDMPSTSHHVELVLYADNTAVIVTSRKADATRQLPGVLPQRPSTVVERIENRHKSFQEQRDYIRECRTAFHSAPTSHTLRGTNPICRYYSLSGGRPR